MQGGGCKVCVLTEYPLKCLSFWTPFNEALSLSHSRHRRRQNFHLFSLVLSLSFSTGKFLRAFRFITPRLARIWTYIQRSLTLCLFKNRWTPTPCWTFSTSWERISNPRSPSTTAWPITSSWTRFRWRLRRPPTEWPLHPAPRRRPHRRPWRPPEVLRRRRSPLKKSRSRRRTWEPFKRIDRRRITITWVRGKMSFFVCDVARLKYLKKNFFFFSWTSKEV